MLDDDTTLRNDRPEVILRTAEEAGKVISHERHDSVAVQVVDPPWEAQRPQVARGL